MKKVLILYGSKYGTTEDIAKEIAKELKSNNINPNLLKLNKKDPDKFPKIEEYNGILVGSGIYMNNWIKSMRKFFELKNTELNNDMIKFGLFISCGAGCAEEIYEFARETYINAVIKKYDLKPDIYEIFGSYFDLTKDSKFGYIYRKLLLYEMRKTIEKFNVQMTLEDNKVYDYRNWDKIRNFAKLFAKIVLTEKSVPINNPIN